MPHTQTQKKNPINLPPKNLSPKRIPKSKKKLLFQDNLKKPKKASPIKRPTQKIPLKNPKILPFPNKPLPTKLVFFLILDVIFVHILYVKNKSLLYSNAQKTWKYFHWPNRVKV